MIDYNEALKSDGKKVEGLLSFKGVNFIIQGELYIHYNAVYIMGYIGYSKLDPMYIEMFKEKGYEYSTIMFNTTGTRKNVIALTEVKFINE